MGTPRREGSRTAGSYPVAKSQRNSTISRVPAETQLTRPIARPPHNGRSVIPISRYQTPTVVPTESGRFRRPAGSIAGAPEPVPTQGRSGRRRVPPVIHAVRLLILGVGVGAITGTFLSIFDPASQSTPDISQMTMQGSVANPANESSPMLSRLIGGSNTATLQRTQEIVALKSSLQSLLSQNPHLTAGVSVVDLDTGAYVDLNATTRLPAASTIKVPVLVAFLQAVDAGTVRLDEVLTMEAGDLAEGSGEMQYQAIGTQFSALETAEMMITISDNTATNMLIRRLGGMVALNQQFQSWGLRQTVFHHPLADLEGTNTTSSEDLTNLLMRVSQGELLSLRSRDRLMEIMQATVADSLIPAGVGDQRAVIAHKTGTLDHLVGDTGIVDMPNGKRFIVTVLVQRPIDDESAAELIRQACSTVYQYLGQSAVVTPESTSRHQAN